MQSKGAKRKYARKQIRFKKKGRTKQSFKAECDINNIVGRFAKSGIIEHENTHTPQYGFAPNMDLKESFQMMQNASEKFENLSPEIRENFNNSPAEFLEFVDNPSNRPEWAAMGLTPNDPDTDPNSAPNPRSEASAPSEANSEPENTPTGPNSSAAQLPT